MKAKRYLDEKTKAVRRKIQSADYERLEQVQDALSEIKTEYLTDGAGPKYPGYEILLAETITELLSKASDYLSISQSQSSAILTRRLNERVKDLESELKDLRCEHQDEVRAM
jgi:hypothetical protein